MLAILHGLKFNECDNVVQLIVRNLGVPCMIEQALRGILDNAPDALESNGPTSYGGISMALHVDMPMD